MAGGGSKTPEGGVVVVASPARHPTFCLPLLFGGGGRRQRLRRAQTMDSVPSARRQQEGQQQEQQEQGQGQGDADALGAVSSRTIAGNWPWLAAGAAASGAEKGRRRTTMDGPVPPPPQQQQRQEAFSAVLSPRKEVAAAATTAVAATSSMTTTSTITTTTVTAVASSVTATTATSSSTATTSSTSITRVVTTMSKPAASTRPPPPSLRIIPSEFTDDVTAYTRAAPSSSSSFTTTTATITAAPAQAQATPTTKAAAAAAPKRWAGLRSQSMGAVPATSTRPPPSWYADPNDRFYPPGLRKRDSLGDSSAGRSSSIIDELAPSLGAFRRSASQRRRSFAGSTAHSRRGSLEELTVREDFAFHARSDAPPLPPRLLPMVSHGMARLAINMKEEVMTPAKWEVVLSLLPPEDAARVKRYRFDKDRRLALGSQLLQRAVIAWTFGLPYRDILIVRTEKGKPFFHVPPHVDTPFPNWNYNVSHHGDFVGIASEPVCLVGLDIMNAKERPRRNSTANEFFRSFHRQLSGVEWGAIYQAPNDDGKLERFYRQWALKEAYIKAIGSGLSFSPRRIEITGLKSPAPLASANTETPYDPSVLRIDGMERPDWRFKFSGLDQGHVACVSRGPPSDAIDDFRQVLRVQHLPNSPLRFGLESIQPGFDIISLRELIPQDRLAAFDATLVDTPVLLTADASGGAGAAAGVVVDVAAAEGGKV